MIRQRKSLELGDYIEYGAAIALVILIILIFGVSQ